MEPRTKPKLSRTTFTIGTRQFVVHEALEMMLCALGSYFWLLTPMTTVMSSPFAGAEMITFLAPPAICRPALSADVKRPVDSSTMSTPSSFHGSLPGSFSARTLISSPSTVIEPSPAVTSPAKVRCTESYLNRCASVFVSVRSFTATNSRSATPAFLAARTTWRPIRPNPLMPTLVAIPLCSGWLKPVSAGAGPAECQVRNYSSSCVVQHLRARIESGRRGDDVVDQNDVCATHFLPRFTLG